MGLERIGSGLGFELDERIGSGDDCANPHSPTHFISSQPTTIFPPSPTYPSHTIQSEYIRFKSPSEFGLNLDSNGVKEEFGCVSYSKTLSVHFSTRTM